MQLGYVGIDIDKHREAEIKSYFSNDTEVHIAQEQDKLDSLIELFRKPIYSIFSLQVFLIILFQKLSKVIVFYKVKNMFLHVCYGYVGFLVI